MLSLEEITDNAGHDALADQACLVACIRQHTGTQLAAHTLVSSFLGATAVHAHGFHGWGWPADALPVLGLAVTAIVPAPWRLDFSINAGELYRALYDQAAAEAEDASLAG